MVTSQLHAGKHSPKTQVIFHEPENASKAFAFFFGLPYLSFLPLFLLFPLSFYIF
jgi:hypothetical protein